ncbi:MAG: thioredoxin [Clostridium argentinense]|uniref:Thioredoxin n=1 Tax=Clostridium faecium TaxID=2762223 RepID=A0ABR8YRY1_9CLOT|nr:MULTISPECIES: CD1871A family CXXC motif-containing protein [Clostridium]MBD8047001.1 thioredoxin [Clostridium faecium]MBS5822584.1 thioredoxin [Clostridium argentinense]MDU1348023.1 CD1871A family CXXC motif-containing protein [Clostridium argentinense]
MKEKILKYGILIGSVFFIVLGSMRGEYRTVLKKAINICLECIGIG